MNRFDTAMSQLNSRMGSTNAAGVTITYHRGEDSVVITDAVRGSTPFRVVEQGNERVEWSDVDYYIPAASLVFNGVPVEPQSTDWIEETVNGIVKQYRPYAPVAEQPWRYTDHEETRWIIHCAKWVKV